MNFFVVDAFAKKNCLYHCTAVTRRYVTYTFEQSWIRPHKFIVVPSCGSGLVTLGEFGIVPLRENVPGFFMLPCAGGSHFVHGLGLEFPEELFKPVSHSTQCTSDVSRTRPPSSRTGVRAARRREGVGRGYALPSRCAIHETSYTIQVLSLHALSCISVSSPSVTRAALRVGEAPRYCFG